MPKVIRFLLIVSLFSGVVYFSPGLCVHHVIAKDDSVPEKHYIRKNPEALGRGLNAAPSQYIGNTINHVNSGEPDEKSGPPVPSVLPNYPVPRPLNRPAKPTTMTKESVGEKEPTPAWHQLKLHTDRFLTLRGLASRQISELRSATPDDGDLVELLDALDEELKSADSTMEELKRVEQARSISPMESNQLMGRLQHLQLRLEWGRRELQKSYDAKLDTFNTSGSSSEKTGMAQQRASDMRRNLMDTYSKMEISRRDAEDAIVQNLRE